jgi:5-formyltetrahydrofolate cyclo-ligase
MLSYCLNDRQSIRSALREQRSLLSLSVQGQAARVVSSFAAEKDWFQQSSHFAFYVAVRNEIDPYLLLEKACQLGKTCYLPVCFPSKHEPLCFVAYFPGDPLRINDYGILEPLLDIRKPCEISLLDGVFVPLLAFDRLGNRLGSGKGYYDKTFAHLLGIASRRKTTLVGLGYEFQQVDELSAESWDVPLDKAVMFDRSVSAAHEINFRIAPEITSAIL